MVRVGVIGYGYWGPNLVRNFGERPNATLVMVSDLREEALAKMRARYPSVQATTDFTEVMKNPDIDAVAIATPVSTHFDLAMHALRAGKHVLVEKPMAATSDQCRRLIDEALARKLVLMVDYTFPYSPPVRKIRELIVGQQLGAVLYYDSVRVNLGLFQHDVNVIWDLAVHDLSIMDFIIPTRPVAVSSTGIAHVPGQPENTAYLTLFFDASLIAHIHVNWLAPVKIRQTLIGGSEKMIVYDDLEPTEKVKVYDKGITVADADTIRRMRIGYRMGDMWAPNLDSAEPLQLVTSHFLSCVADGQQPMTDGNSGLRVVRIMEAATESMGKQGEPVRL